MLAISIFGEVIIIRFIASANLPSFKAVMASFRKGMSKLFTCSIGKFKPPSLDPPPSV